MQIALSFRRRALLEQTQGDEQRVDGVQTAFAKASEYGAIGLCRNIDSALYNRAYTKGVSFPDS